MNKEDVIAETRDQIQKWFDSSVFSKKIRDGTATIEDIDRIAKNTANILVTNFKRALGDAYELDLPLGEDVIRSFLPKAMENNYDFLNTVSAQIQHSVDLQKGLRIKAQKVSFPAERVDKIAAAAGRAEDPEKLRRIIDAPVRNVVDSFTDDYVKANADFRSRAGLETHIVRRTDGSCCEWCSKLAGKYRYPDEVPKDVFRRHDNCTCTVTYINGKSRQDVWSKKTWNADEETIEKRKELAAKKPTVLTKEQAALREQEVREKYKKKVDISGESGIIKEKKSEWDNDLKPRGQVIEQIGEDNLYSFVAKELKIDENEAIEYVDSVMSFTDDYYSDIRSYQQGILVDNIEEIRTMSDNIEGYIKKAPRWNGGETFRGISASDDFMSSLEIGSPVDMKGVASWSDNIGIAKDFSKQKIDYENPNSIIFHCQTQDKGTGIRHLSVYENESEILSSKDSRYHVSKIEKTDDGFVHVYLKEE